jgi:hypothetical protein
MSKQLGPFEQPFCADKRRNWSADAGINIILSIVNATVELIRFKKLCTRSRDTHWLNAQLCFVNFCSSEVFVSKYTAPHNLDEKVS